MEKGERAEKSDPTKELNPALGTLTQSNRVDSALKKNVEKMRNIKSSLKRKKALKKNVDRVAYSQERRIAAEKAVLKLLKEVAAANPDTKKFKQELARVTLKLEAVLKEEEGILGKIIEIRKEREKDWDMTKSMKTTVLANTLRLAKNSAVYPGQATLNVWSAPVYRQDEVAVLKTKQPDKHE